MPRRPARSPSSSWLSSFLIGVLLFLGLLSAFWYWSAAQTEKLFNTWVKWEATQGHTISYADKNISGFPFRVKLFLGHITWDRLEGTGASSRAILITAWPWQWGSFDLDFPQGGEVALHVPSLENPVGFKSYEETTGHVTLGAEGRLKSFKLSGIHLAAGSGHQSFFNTDGWDAELSDPPLPPRTNSDTGLFIRFQANNIIFANDKIPLGPRINNLAASLRVRGIPPNIWSRQSLNVWNQTSGVIEVDDLAIDWVPLEAHLTGTIGLTPNLQIEGALTASIKNFPKTLEALTQGNWLSKAGAATIEQAAATNLIKPEHAFATPDAKSNDEIKLPITLQNGKMMLGDAALISLPLLRWPQ